jgi:hypothetical protein
MFFDEVANKPSAHIASNGIEVLDGALGNVRFNRVTGNECNLTGVCGPDPINDTEASGILAFASAPKTVIADNNVTANDMGVYTDDGIHITDNSISDNRAVGLYVDTDAVKLHATGNTTDRDGYYGIAIGPMFPVSQGGTGLPNPGGNFFVENSAFGNVKFDLYQSPDAGPNTNNDNHCNTALPSKAYWDCEPSEHGNDGDEDDGGDNGDGDGHGSDHSPHHVKPEK